jgi:D-serine deaminase-like pyridoxal phosphate-dependent protein
LEVQTVNNAAKLAQELLLASHSTSKHTQPFIISVGSTPTAHAFAEPTGEVLAQLKSELCGKLELHAGNYPVLDLQQIHTSLIGEDRVSHRILATVISYYAGRAKDGEDEAMCDAGAIAMSKDTGPSGGFGDVVGHKWKLGRVSQVRISVLMAALTDLIIQEHGVLVQTEPGAERLKIGSVVQLISQHVCLTAANHAWYYVVDSEAEGGADTVMDVWVAWKGW